MNFLRLNVFTVLAAFMALGLQAGDKLPSEIKAKSIKGALSIEMTQNGNFLDVVVTNQGGLVLEGSDLNIGLQDKNGKSHTLLAAKMDEFSGVDGTWVFSIEEERVKAVIEALKANDLLDQDVIQKSSFHSDSNSYGYASVSLRTFVIQDPWWPNQDSIEASASAMTQCNNCQWDNASSTVAINSLRRADYCNNCSRSHAGAIGRGYGCTAYLSGSAIANLYGQGVYANATLNVYSCDN